MKNFEKYKTPEKAADAFYSYCNNKRCEYCFFYKNFAVLPCNIQWLYYDDEKNPTPQWEDNLMNKFTRKD